MMLIGLAISLLGVSIFARATWLMWSGWSINYDAGYVGWFLGALIAGSGFDLVAGHRYRKPRDAWWWLLPIFIVGIGFRFANVTLWGEGYATQVEVVQAGMFGAQFLFGSRMRWEHTLVSWVSASGMWLFGYTQLAVRSAFLAVSVLVLVPMYGWMLTSVGVVGAVISTLLLATSRWHIINSYSGHADMILIPLGFWALALARKRQHWSSYVWIGVIAGFVLSMYVVYRPLAPFLLLGACCVSRRDGGAGRMVKAARPLVASIAFACLAVPLFVSGIKLVNVRNEYLNGWDRAKAQEYWVVPKTPMERWDAFTHRLWEIKNLFWYGDQNPARSVRGAIYPILSIPVLCLAGIGLVAGSMWYGDPTMVMLNLALLCTMFGGLCMTGTAEIVRAVPAMPYIYAVVGIGAATLSRLAKWGHVGWLAVLLMAGTVTHSAAVDASYIVRYWSDVDAQRANRKNGAYLASWIARNALPNERVIVVSSGEGSNIFLPNDASWLLGNPAVKGVNVPNAHEAVPLICPEGETRSVLLVIFDGHRTKDTEAELKAETGLSLEYVADPLDGPGVYIGGDIAYLHHKCA